MCIKKIIDFICNVIGLTNEWKRIIYVNTCGLSMPSKNLRFVYRKTSRFFVKIPLTCVYNYITKQNWQSLNTSLYLWGWTEFSHSDGNNSLMTDGHGRLLHYWVRETLVIPDLKRTKNSFGCAALVLICL